MPKPARSAESISTEIAALEVVSHADLKKRWSEFFDAPCPPHMSRKFLTRAIGYQIQVRALGGLDRVTRRRLDRAATDLEAGRPIVPAVPAIKPGTRLLREWQGRVHEVLILEEGVEYRGTTWPSLSAVAREITGTRWSGPRFFGLNGGDTNGGG